MMDKTILNKYEILEELGRGGFGVVYKARNVDLDRNVAVKVLHPNLVNDLSFITRFRNEARLAAPLNHPNIVPVHDFGESEGFYYIVMGLMPGGSLKEMRQREGALSEEKALNILSQIAAGLSYANHKGIIHRDLKPGNILFDELGEARVSDLGFAKLLHSDSSASLTMSGGVVGTPAYMAPEIWKGLPATPAVDVYSSACIFVEMLTGKQLFEGDSTPVIMLKHSQPVSLPENLPEHWKPIILKALSQDPENRHLNLSSFVADLEHSTQLFDIGTKKVPECSDNESGDEAAVVGTEPEVKQIGKLISQKKNASPTKEKRNKTSQMIGFGIGTLAILLFLVFLLINSKEKNIFSALPTQTPFVIIEKQIPTPLEDKPVLVETVAVLTEQFPTNTQTQIQTTNTISKTPPNKYESDSILGIGSTMIREKDDMEMVYVPAGEFTMGNEEVYFEGPVRQVYLDAYWIDKYEVSNAQYTLCVEAGACTKPSQTNSSTREKYYGNPDYDSYPVIYINWHQALTYCEWAGGSLPTEAQWEKAARWTDGRTYPWGEAIPSCQLANLYRCIGDTKPVTDYKSGASPYGAFNMAGNVMEWVYDMYGLYIAEDTINPIGYSQELPERRVIRGGCWNAAYFYQSCYSRRNNMPIINKMDDVGFRCALPQP